MHTALHLIQKLAGSSEAGPNALPSQQDMRRGNMGSTAGRLLVITTGSTTKVEH